MTSSLIQRGSSPDRGEVVTFYSFKGGTGRSMMLANVAWILASNGRRVLTIDWDLEAPGLHRYFRPFLADQDLSDSDGVIDFAIDFCVAATMANPAAEPPGPGQGASKPVTKAEQAFGIAKVVSQSWRPATRSLPPTPSTVPDWYDDYADITRYAIPLQWSFPDDGAIDFVGAGRQGTSYSTRVNGFSWRDFYERFDGGAMLQRAREKMIAQYDFVLIDSRTGVSDTSGICTVQLPDSLVACFTLNNQSIDGASAVAESARGQREALTVLPVPMRIENSEKEKLEARRDYAMHRFERLLPGASRGEHEAYWRDVEVPYIPIYAYEEILATFRDRVGSSLTLLDSAERLTSRIAHKRMGALRMTELERQRVLATYEGRIAQLAALTSTSQSAVYISYRRVDSGYAIRLFDRLAATLGIDRVAKDVAILPGDDFSQSIERAIQAASTVVVVIGPHWFVGGEHDWTRREVETAINTGRRVIPVLVGGATLPAQSELRSVGLGELGTRQAAVIGDQSWDRDVDRLVAAVELASARETLPAQAPGAQDPVMGATSERSAEVIDQVLQSRTSARRAQAISVAIALAVSFAASLLAFYLSR